MPSERYLKYEKPRREWYIQHGICPVCGNEPQVKELTKFCPKCGALMLNHRVDKL